MSVIHIKSAAEFDTYLSKGKCAVDFTAVWCGPCQFIGPKFDALSKKYTTIQFLKVDVDEVAEIAERLAISAMPTFCFFDNGQQSVSQLVGANEKELDRKLTELESS
uniref:Thioredoxin n=1 Tax=Arcella intermedia TaxID=1963864 RepID=A0A6B2LT81_9EUKA